MVNEYEQTPFYLTTTESANQGICGGVGRDVFLFNDHNDVALFEIVLTYADDESKTASLSVKQLTDVKACEIPKVSSEMHLGCIVLELLDSLLYEHDVEFYADVFEYDTDKGVMLLF
jgi:hypothetical protein